MTVYIMWLAGKSINIRKFIYLHVLNFDNLTEKHCNDILLQRTIIGQTST